MELVSTGNRMSHKKLTPHLKGLLIAKQWLSVFIDDRL